MPHWLFKHLPLGCQKKEGFKKAFTLVELLITVAIVGTLGAIAIPQYTSYKDKQNNTTAIINIRDIESQIERFKALNGSSPATLGAANIVAPTDPWGNAYIYAIPSNRWDKFDKPLNPDYDLYSMGKDGKTQPKITQKTSLDDIVRCSGGAYVGLASKY
jgi:general secretion pathway protein G